MKEILEVFGSKEKETIIKVLNQYDMDVVEIKKARSAYKVTTSKGDFCLKRMRHGYNKAKNGSILVKELMENGFINTPKYLYTLNGDIYIKTKNMIFYLTEWIEGTECDLNNLSEAENCAKLLANFHISTNKIDSSSLVIKNNIKNWPQIFNDNISELEKYKKLIQNKRLKNEFDNIFYKYIDNFISRANFALVLLNDSNYYKLSSSALENKSICHDSFYYQNILKKNDEYYIVDLDSIIFDLHINDLGKLIRRLMYKNEYQWNFTKAELIISAYNSVKPLSKEELESMLALIVFPHKFWKLGRKRYVKHKNWSELKYMHKLNRLIKYNELQQDFLEGYLKYLSEYV